MSLRRFITLVESLTREPLMEAQNYEAMFGALIKLDDELHSLSTKTGISNAKTWIAGNIAKAKKVLRKNDRIVWYLKWVRCFIASEMVREWSWVVEGEALYHKRRELKSLQIQYDNQMQKDWGYVTANRPEPFLDLCEHWFSLGLPEIDNFVFTTQSPQAISSEFHQLEDKWRQEQSQLIPRDRDTTEQVVMTFPDGMMWVNLGRPHCRDEGSAMGHCGNTAAYRSGDTVLSLRKVIKKGDKAYWHPSLTFILKSNGTLGEMKGRANEKPAQKYHPYILALLEYKLPDGEYLIEGIWGGGYAPEQNFSVNDLTEEEQNNLFERRPELATALWRFHHQGLVGDVADALKEELEQKAEQTAENWVGEYLWLETFKDFQTLCSEHGDKDMAEYSNHLSGEDIWEFHSGDHIGPQQVESLLEELPEPSLDAIKKYARKEYEDEYEDDEYDFDNLSDLVSILKSNNSEIYSAAFSAVAHGENSGAEAEFFKAVESAITRFMNDLPYRELVFDNESNSFAYDTRLILKMSAENVAKLLDDPEELQEIAYNGWLGEHKVKLTVPYYGFSDYDEEAAVDDFFEQTEGFDFRPLFIEPNIYKLPEEEQRRQIAILLPFADRFANGDPVETAAAISADKVQERLYELMRKFRDIKRPDPDSWTPELKALLRNDEETSK